MLRTIRTFLILLVILTGCSPKLLIQTPAELKLQALGTLTPGGAFALSPDGERIAFARRGLFLQYLSDATERYVMAGEPQALAWSPDGEQLAAAMPMEGQSHLWLFDAAGKQLGDIHIPARVTQLAWLDDGSLLASGLQLKSYSFGANLQAWLFRWDGKWRLHNEKLFDTTLKPQTVKQLGERLYRLLRFDLSPLNDEILYTRLHAPPAFAETLRLVLRNLQTGAESSLLDAELTSGGGRLQADGELALLADGRKEVKLYNPWTGNVWQRWPLAGKSLEFSPASGLIFIDGHLYQNGEELAVVQSESRARFSGDGSRLLVADRGRLALLSGYPVPKVAGYPGVLQQKLKRLRRLRSRGLITVEEYYHTRERLLR